MNKDHSELDCSYLAEFNENEGWKNIIYNHLCSNFDQRFKYEGEYYCIFHLPSDDKVDLFNEAIGHKLDQNHYFFAGTWFPNQASFSFTEFNSPVNFSHVQFTKGAKFDNCKFMAGADFRCAIFGTESSFNFSVFSHSDNSQPDTSFYSTTFHKEASFTHTKFEGPVDFESTEFRNKLYISNGVFSSVVNFSESRFHSAYFSDTIFEKDADFHLAEFNNSSFLKCNFYRSLDMRETKVKELLRFSGTTFNGFARFSSNGNNFDSWESGSLDFKSVDCENPERISFRSILLNPEDFLDTDTRRFEFNNVKWNLKSFSLDWSRSKFWDAEATLRKTQYELLAITYRRLASNAEENHRYREASKLRYTASEIDRIGARWYGRFTPLSLLYKWSSRFGENWLWALFVLIIILGCFSVYYYFALFELCPRGGANSSCRIGHMSIIEAIHHSLMTASFQNVEYRRTLLPEQDIVMLIQKFVTPLQTALLVLAIRRKFMR